MNILQMNIYGSIIITIAVIIRAIAINKLPKRTFIVLWIIAIVRLTVPFTLPPLINVYPVVGKLNEISGERLLIPDGNKQPDIVRIENQPNNSAAENENASRETPEKASYSIHSSIFIWGIGTVIFAAMFVIPHIRNSHKYKSALPFENEYMSEWRTTHTLRRKYRILVSDEIVSPFTFGLFRPVIVLPENTDMINNHTLDYVLTHEYIHVKRFDIALKWISAVCVCLNWFNPLVWVMYVLMNRDIELSCDEGVIKSKGGDSRKTYALMLVDMESCKISYNPLVNSFNKYAVRERVTSIMKNRKLGVISIVLAFVLVVCSASVLVSSCTKGEDEDTTIDADVQQTKSPETTQATTEEDPYANVRFGENKDILLLDIEWHTYDTYLEYIEKEKIRAKEQFKEFYNENEVDEIFYNYIKSREETAEKIKNGTVYVTRSINDIPEDQDGPLTFKNPYNNFDLYTEPNDAPYDDNVYEKDPDGYFIYNIFPFQMAITYPNLKTGSYDFNVFNKEYNGLISSEKEFEYIFENEIKPYCDQKLADGEMPQIYYDNIISMNPRDRLIRLYFPDAVK